MNTQAFDIAIRHARLRGSADRHADIGIKDGRITAIAARLDGSGATEIDAGGNLVTESFVNPHLHLCKVWTLPMMEEEALRAYQGEGMGKALSGIELASKIKEKYAEAWIAENARRAGSKASRRSFVCATNSAALSTCRSSPSRKTASCVSRARRN
jgi:cytosine deaminase